MNKIERDSMTWDMLKSKVYHNDGSLRDIYVLDTTRVDWEKWINYVNSTCNLTWIRDEKKDRKGEKKIDFEIIKQYWDSNGSYESHPAAIMLNDIRVNIFFFTEEEIENDICPSEIKSINDHNRIIDYMQAVSKLLEKDVLLTEENHGLLESEEVLIRVRGEDIFLSQ